MWARVHPQHNGIRRSVALKLRMAPSCPHMGQGAAASVAMGHIYLCRNGRQGAPSCAQKGHSIAAASPLGRHHMLSCSRQWACARAQMDQGAAAADSWVGFRVLHAAAQRGRLHVLEWAIANSCSMFTDHLILRMLGRIHGVNPLCLLCINECFPVMIRVLTSNHKTKHVLLWGEGRCCTNCCCT